MEFLTLNYKKQLKIERKSRDEITSKRVESRVFMELQEKLSKELSENDKVMVEVNRRVLGEFINSLDDRVLALYEYEQLDDNKFVFYNKEIDLDI